jgi:hypothetical protein
MKQHKKRAKTDWADKLEHVLTPRELVVLKDLIIFQDNDGSYQLFNKYIIRKTTKGFEVTSPLTDTNHIFFTLKTATAWCVFDKRDKFYEARRIIDLDLKLGSVDVDIQVHRKMFLKAKSPDDKLVYAAKLSEDKAKKKLMTEELDEYTADSKTWQNRRFDQKPV